MKIIGTFLILSALVSTESFAQSFIDGFNKTVQKDFKQRTQESDLRDLVAIIADVILLKVGLDKLLFRPQDNTQRWQQTEAEHELNDAMSDYDKKSQQVTREQYDSILKKLDDNLKRLKEGGIEALVQFDDVPSGIGGIVSESGFLNSIMKEPSLEKLRAWRTRATEQESFYHRQAYEGHQYGNPVIAGYSSEKSRYYSLNTDIDLHINNLVESGVENYKKKYLVDYLERNFLWMKKQATERRPVTYTQSEKQKALNQIQAKIDEATRKIAAERKAVSTANSQRAVPLKIIATASITYAVLDIGSRIYLFAESKDSQYIPAIELAKGTWQNQKALDAYLKKLDQALEYLKR